MEDINSRYSDDAIEEEIRVLNAISFVSARMARRLAALAKQRQAAEAGDHHGQVEQCDSDQ